jgi:hypothetical protein
MAEQHSSSPTRTTMNEIMNKKLDDDPSLIQSVAHCLADPRSQEDIIPSPSKLFSTVFPEDIFRLDRI